MSVFFPLNVEVMKKAYRICWDQFQGKTPYDIYHSKESQVGVYILKANMYRHLPFFTIFGPSGNPLKTFNVNHEDPGYMFEIVRVYIQQGGLDGD